MQFWSDFVGQKAPNGRAARSCDHLFWRPVFLKLEKKKNIQKGMQNSMWKKYGKLMPNGFQNDAKIETKIDEFSYFF